MADPFNFTKDIRSKYTAYQYNSYVSVIMLRLPTHIDRFSGVETTLKIHVLVYAK